MGRSGGGQGVDTFRLGAVLLRSTTEITYSGKSQRATGRVIAVLMVILVTGCASSQQRGQLGRFNAAYSVGNYEAAADVMRVDGKADGRSGSGHFVLEFLHQGEAYRLAGDFEDSIQAFDRAEDGMKYLDTEGVVAGAAGNVMSVLVNESSRDYRALMSEAILVNTYKGLAFLALGDGDNARVEFNRADDRTRRAVDFFADEIRTERQRVQEDRTNGQTVGRTLESRDMRRTLNESYGDPAAWSVYPEYMVPASTYLHGLFFLAASTGSADTEKAVASLGRVADMAPDNPTVAADADLAEALASGRQSRRQLAPKVWVMYENGLGPVLEEVRFDIPLPISRHGESQVIFTGIALPRYRDRRPVPGELSVTGDGRAVVVTQPVASMGKVIRTEMQARFSGVLMRAVASAVVKGYIQSEAAETMGALGQFGAILYTVSTTQADLRGWQAMPDHWEMARLDRPANGRITLADSRLGELGEVRLPEWPYTLVYVKRPTSESPATVMILDLQGRNQGQRLTLPARSGGANETRVAQSNVN